MFELVDATNQAAVIKVIGVGGGGGNALQHMLSANIEGVEFICAILIHKHLEIQMQKLFCNWVQI